MNKKKVLTIVPSMYGGGAEKIVADLSFYFTKIFNHKLLVYNKKEKSYNYSGKLEEILIDRSSFIFGKIYRQIKIQNAIKNHKIKEKNSITISHMLMANIHNILSKKEDIIICVLHGEWSVISGKGSLLDYFIGKIYSKADVLISVSHHVKNIFQQKHNLQIPHEVVYIGIEIDKIIELSNEKIVLNNLPDKFVVYVAGFRPVKNHLQLLHQLKNFLLESNIHLVLLGDGPLKDDIEKFIVENNLDHKVLILGNLKNPFPVIKKAKASILASKSESFSLVILESMALGVPVIATDCGGPREILLEDYKENVKLPHISKNGILIDHPDKWKVDTVENSLKALLLNTELYDKISKNGITRAKDFTIEKTAEKFNTFIKKF